MQGCLFTLVTFSVGSFLVFHTYFPCFQSHYTLMTLTALPRLEAAIPQDMFSEVQTWSNILSTNLSLEKMSPLAQLFTMNGQALAFPIILHLVNCQLLEFSTKCLKVSLLSSFLSPGLKA